MIFNVLILPYLTASILAEIHEPDAESDNGPVIPKNPKGVINTENMVYSKLYSD
jgi:hypothetical protein